jgi:hypothetical protein
MEGRAFVLHAVLHRLRYLGERAESCLGKLSTGFEEYRWAGIQDQDPASILAESILKIMVVFDRLHCVLDLQPIDTVTREMMDLLMMHLMCCNYIMDRTESSALRFSQGYRLGDILDTGVCAKSSVLDAYRMLFAHLEVILQPG